MKADRLFLLDVLRGLASIAVVIWHYQHFYYADAYALSADFARSGQPFYGALWVFYEHGARAVDLFFALSGFIFFHYYADAIRDRRVRAKEFFVLRFSRLYPLHAATLLFVAAGQALSYAIDQRYIVYACNDASRFFLNLTFLMHWLPQSSLCWSFNAPAWSISVEIFLYALFFAVALRLPQTNNGKIAVTVCIVGLSLIAYRLNAYHLLTLPVTAFFAGGVSQLIDARWGPRAALSLGLSALVTCLLFAVLIHRLPDAAEAILAALTYPSLILALASVQRLRPDSGKTFRLLGDITYATYLLHFPLQLTLLLLVKAGVVSLDFSDRSIWLIFFAMLFALAIPVYYGFERPAQRLLRQHLTPRQPAPT